MTDELKQSSDPQPLSNAKPRRFYSKPPIVEAVIDTRFRGSMDEKDLARAAQALAKWYPQKQAMQNVRIDASPEGVSHTVTSDGFRLTAEDGQRVVLIQPGGITSAHLAPYPGWDAFQAIAMQTIRRLRDKIGVRPLGRVSVRFINRIDIPTIGNVIDSFNYVSFGPNNPASWGDTTEYHCKSVNKMKDDNRFTSILQTGLTDSPLIDHVAIFLDIDVLYEGEVSSTETGILELLAKLREFKNALFERSITEQARTLFG